MMLWVIKMLIPMTYHRDMALQYAEKWALGRNPKYYNFDSLGGDCTNFVSQCLYAGSRVMNYTPTLGWYYTSLQSRTPSWTGVKYLYNFLTTNDGVGPWAKEVSQDAVIPGDIIQLSNGEEFYHTLLVIKKEGRDIFIACHTFDAYMRPLSSYSYAHARFLHIEGVRGYGK